MGFSDPKKWQIWSKNFAWADIKHKYLFLFILFQKNKIYDRSCKWNAYWVETKNIEDSMLFHIILPIEFFFLLTMTRTLFWSRLISCIFYQLVRASVRCIVSMWWNAMNPAIKTSRTRKYLEYSRVYRLL